MACSGARRLQRSALPGTSMSIASARWSELAAGMAREAMLYFTFEDERLGGMTAAHLDLIVEAYCGTP